MIKSRIFPMLGLVLLLVGLTTYRHPIAPPASVNTSAPLMAAQSQPLLKGSEAGFTWRNVNLQGMGYVTGIVIQPTAPHDVYIRTDVGGIYRFDRSQQYWIPLTDSFSGNIGVESVAIDPNQPNSVYLVMNRPNGVNSSDQPPTYTFAAEVYQSRDRGETWQSLKLGPKRVFTGPNEDYRMSTGERLVVDPHRSGRLFFASRRDGLWRYEGSWQRVQGGLPDPKSLPDFLAKDGKPNPKIPGFTFITFDSKSSSRTVYLGIHAVGSPNGGIWQSTDGGTSWKNIGGADNPLRGVVAADGTFYGVFGENGDKPRGSVRKFQAGQWTEITPDRARFYSGITVQADRPLTLMTVSDDRVYRSVNGGASWQLQKMTMNGVAPADDPRQTLNPSAPPYYSFASGGAATIAIDPSNFQQVWWLNGWGVARTENGDARTPVWSWQMRNLEELVARILRVPPKAGGADLLANGADLIGFRIEDRNQVPRTAYNPIGVPINPDFAWAMPRHWKTYPVPFPHIATGTGLDYSYRNPDYAAFVGWHQWQYWPVHGLTRDNGRTWQAFPSIPKLHWNREKNQYEEKTPIAGQIALSPTDPQTMVWAPTWGVDPHYTRDGGRSWQPCKLVDGKPLPNAWANTISPWVTPFILTADRADPRGKTFYYFDGWIFYISQDGGETWQPGAKSGLPQWIVQPAIVPNPLKPEDIWMSFPHNQESVQRQKLYHSTDGGKTFQVVPTVDSAEAIAFGKGPSPQTPSLYLFGRINGASRDAIYQSDNLAQTWQRISDPNTQQFPGLLTMEGDMRTRNLVYLSLGGRGIVVGEKK